MIQQIQNFLNLDDTLVANLFNIPTDATLVIRRAMNGDKFQPTWKEYPIKVNTFLRNYPNILSHQRSTVVVIEMRHHSITQIIAVPPFVAPQYERMNDSDTYNRNRRKHMRVQISNKFIHEN